MDHQYYIRNEHLVLRNTYDLCRFCLCVRLNMRRIKHLELVNSNIPQLYEDATTYKVGEHFFSSLRRLSVNSIFVHSSTLVMNIQN